MTGMLSSLRSLPAAGELVTYGGLAALGLSAALYGQQYGLFNDEGEVGPGLLPVVVGSLLCFIALALVVQAAVARRTHATPGSGAEDATATGTLTTAELDFEEEPDALGRTSRERVHQLWTVFGLLFVTLLVVPLLGLIGAFGVLVLVVSAWVERRRVLPSVAVAVGACVFIYLVFVTFLRVPVPVGVLGF
jgi:hypothetical protein